jgi:hypothetical protein
LSYHRASESAPFSGPSTITVCTNDVALGDLVEHGVPVAVMRAFGEAEAVVAKVIGLGGPADLSRRGQARSLAGEVDEVESQLGDGRSNVCSIAVECLKLVRLDCP